MRFSPFAVAALALVVMACPGSIGNIDGGSGGGTGTGGGTATGGGEGGGNPGTGGGNGGEPGKAVLNWEAPTANADGSPLTDLGGYKVHHQLMGGTEVVVDVGNVITHTLTGLAAGQTNFWVTAYDTSNNESAPSNQASKTVQ